MGQQVYQHTLPNGLVLLAERMDHVRSAAINFLVPAGSAFDPAGKLGVASVLAEMITRGAGARDSRGPATLEETLEILGASQLQIDTGSNETINESGVRHLRVEVQRNSPFSKLLERLSERLKKP